MKARYLLILLCLLASACSESDARMGTIMIGGGTLVSGATPCETAGCDGTYMFCWTGDYAADTDKACFTSGGAVKDGSQIGTVEIDAAYGRSGNGIQINAANESWMWVIAANDGIDDAVGTLWVSVYVPDLTVAINFCEANSGSTVNDLDISVGASERLSGDYRGNSSTDAVPSPATTGVIDIGEWTRVMYSWDFAGDKHKVCVDKDTGGDKDAGECKEDTADALTEWTVDPAELHIGEDMGGAAPAEYVYVDDLKVLSTYDAADPNPL